MRKWNIIRFDGCISDKYFDKKKTPANCQILKVILFMSFPHQDLNFLDRFVDKKNTCTGGWIEGRKENII